MYSNKSEALALAVALEVAHVQANGKSSSERTLRHAAAFEGYLDGNDQSDSSES